jgi:retron-type reverse transcriptase
MKRKEDRKFTNLEVITPAGTNETDLILTQLSTIKNGKHIGLLKIIANESVLLSAFERILKNSGYYSKGADNIILSVVDEEFFKGLSKEIGCNSYQPKPTRRVMIPKPNGGLRPLGISCSIDKVVQEAMRFVLELIYEPLFSCNSHGFRPHKSCHTALNQYKLQFSSAT